MESKGLSDNTITRSLAVDVESSRITVKRLLSKNFSPLLFFGPPKQPDVCWLSTSVRPSQGFHRAMLCIAICCRKMSVCLSVTRRYSVETAKHIIKLLSRSASHTILVFFSVSNGMTIFRLGPLTGASNAVKWYMKQELSYRK